MYENIEALLPEIDKQPYGLTVNKLQRKDSMELKDKDRKFVDRDRSFFCSELVAKMYKVLGIFKPDSKSSTQYYPHNFSQKGD